MLNSLHLILALWLRASQVAQLVKDPPAVWRCGFDPWVREIPREEEKATNHAAEGESGMYEPQKGNSKCPLLFSFLRIIWWNESEIIDNWIVGKYSEDFTICQSLLGSI